MCRFLMSIKVWVFIEVCREIFCKSRLILLELECKVDLEETENTTFI